MKLTILGSGTVCPTPDRNASGYQVEADGKTLIFDMGAGVLRAAGKTACTIDALFLTHIHPDHTADLTPYFFALNYALDWQREHPLPIYAPTGFTRFLEKLEGAWEWVKPSRFERQVHELADGDQVTLGDLTVQAFQVYHGEDMEARSYRLEYDGKVLCYSGDSAVCDGLERSAAGADLFLCECAIPRGYPQRGAHMISDEVGQLATRVAAKRVVLTHIYPHGLDLAAQVKDFYAGPVEQAHDGAVYEV